MVHDQTAGMCGVLKMSLNTESVSTTDFDAISRMPNTHNVCYPTGAYVSLVFLDKYIVDHAYIQ